jgi:hypothetical protein
MAVGIVLAVVGTLFLIIKRRGFSVVAVTAAALLSLILLFDFAS